VCCECAASVYGINVYERAAYFGNTALDHSENVLMYQLFFSFSCCLYLESVDSEAQRELGSDALQLTNPFD